MSMCIGAQSVEFGTGANFKRPYPASLKLPCGIETGFVINNGQGCFATLNWFSSNYRSKQIPSNFTNQLCLGWTSDETS